MYLPELKDKIAFDGARTQSKKHIADPSRGGYTASSSEKIAYKEAGTRGCVLLYLMKTRTQWEGGVTPEKRMRGDARGEEEDGGIESATRKRKR